MLRIPVPHPTSRTTLSLKMCLFWYIASRYDLVRTSSFCQASKLEFTRNRRKLGSNQHLLMNAVVIIASFNQSETWESKSMSDLVKYRTSEWSIPTIRSSELSSCLGTAPSEVPFMMKKERRPRGRDIWSRKPIL